jgi:hypothetical protein
MVRRACREQQLLLARRVIRVCRRLRQVLVE